MKSSLRRHLYELIFPESCPICRKKSNWEVSPFCKECWLSIEKFSCHKITTGKFDKEFWRYIKSLHSFGSYEGTLKEAIHYFKYEKIKRLGKELGKLMCQIPLINIDILIPVPLTKNKLLQRGFNQSAILTNYLSKCWNKPLNLVTLFKIKDTLEQASLEAKYRTYNVKDAYNVIHSLRDLRIGLVDDVVTTGATLTECAKLLKKAGAKEIHAITLARAI
ncbi:ComF family protein [Thermodesulfovibrio sp.]|jgi:ComF family protein|uniref:ComF family protein n=1 Tax=Thermodesulfovibrio TaxID=28261 RepID=UPI002603D7FB|nr:ComF family protein [Thermodesulfovibrio sp.]